MDRFKESPASKQIPTAQIGRPSTAVGAKVIFKEELPTLKEANQLLIKEAMERAQGNQSIAARLLGISHQALSQRLKKSL